MKEIQHKKAEKQYIRRADEKDFGRIAEIYVFNNRMEYFPVFGNVPFSFGELQVLSYVEQLKETAAEIFVYDDGVIKGFVLVKEQEIDKLHIESFFQGQGIGALLLRHAIEACGAKYLWVLEKNTRALGFYQSQGLNTTKEKEILYGPEGKTEWMVKMTVKDRGL